MYPIMWEYYTFDFEIFGCSKVYFSNYIIIKLFYMNTHSQIDNILIDRRKHSSVLDVQSFRTADCDTDRYLVVAKIRERIAVNKQGSHKFHMERFNLKKLNEVEGKEKYRFEVSNRLAALEDLDAEVEMNTIWETITENIKNIRERESRL
jgi:hypothetical protein